MEIELIELGRLLDHPLNSNVMSVDQMLKLKRQIGGSGRVFSAENIRPLYSGDRRRSARYPWTRCGCVPHYV